MLKNKYKNGFTIIEVVLVLAIAGLIFLMVFVALPALQRTQRDAQRKRQAETYIDSLIRLKNNGAKPDMWRTYISNTSVEGMVERGYLKESEMIDPSTGVVYGAARDFWQSYDEENVEPGDYVTILHSDCDVPIEERWGQLSKNKTAFWFGMESGGSYCVDAEGNFAGNAHFYD